MKAERQCDPVVFIGQLPDLRHQTAGRDRDVPPRDMESVFVRDHTDETGELIVVIERFTGAHDDDVVDPGTGRPLDLVDLSEHLSTRQIPCEAVEGRGTELTAHAAADLRGDADTVPVLVLHPDGLDDVSVLHTEDKFLRPIDLRGEHLDRFRQGHTVLRTQPIAESLRDVRHLIVVLHQILVQPGIDLLSTERLLAHLLEQLFQILQF